ncbi:MAG: helix-turn-helix domain-containing protein [Candidatus Omnitrophica bacterium]|nr:helix-turn-helix domain-containing protein [Candidatus Omnitrophota bacterium]
MAGNDWAPHPGEFIREELAARGWNQRDLAFILGCPEQAVNMIISGKRGISPEMTKAFGDAFDVSAELFSNLQRAYDLAHATAPNPGIAKRARIQSKYPIREMIKRGWLEETDVTLLEIQVAKFFEVDDINNVPYIEHAAKKTDYADILPEQLAWLYRVRQIAKSITVPKYSEKALQDAIPRLKQCLVDPEEIRQVPRLLAECGIRFVLVEVLPSSKIDGVCSWLDEYSPIIGMSLRLDRIDNFWFVLRHEIEHVLRRHGRKNVVIDADMDKQDGAIPEEEQLANVAASDFCVPREDMDSFIVRKTPFFSEKDVLGFSTLMQRHPGVVVGQLHARTKKYELFRKFLIKIRSFALRGATIDGWGQVFPVTL